MCGAMCVSKNCPTPPAGRRRDAAAAVCTVFARKLQAGCCPLSAERLVANISAAAGRGAGVRQLCKYCGGRGGAATPPHSRPEQDDLGTSAAVETVEKINRSN